MVRILTTAEVTAGDILLCYTSHPDNPVAKATGSRYSHAAICVAEDTVAESTLRGVQRSKISELFDGTSHIAVFHQPDFWPPERVAKLNQFIDWAVAKQARFNFRGLDSFEASREAHQRDLMEKLESFFDGHQPAPASARERYFCSELVAACLIAVGLVAPSAAVVYNPSVIAPKDLANDGVFGFFCGYLVSDPAYKIPTEDDFISREPMGEWWDQV